MMWPGDWSGGAAEVAHCRCVLDVETRKYDMTTRDGRVAYRIDAATVISEGVYDMTPEAIAAEAQVFDGELDGIIAANNAIWKSKKQYANYARHVEGKATKAPITIDDFTKIEGKELQIAQWFSTMGVSVHFRNHNKLTNKSDVEMFGTLFDFKRVTSPNPAQITSLVHRKLKTQGPGFVIDISMSEIGLDDAIKECASLLEDDRVKRMLIIKDAQVVELKK